MINIIDKAYERIVPCWAKFININDSFQGTYIGKIMGYKNNFGEEEIIYQLLQEDGTIINVGLRLSKKAIHTMMLGVKLGQVIGFQFKGLLMKEDKISGEVRKIKDIALFESPKVFNEVWLKEKEYNILNK